MRSFCLVLCLAAASLSSALGDQVIIKVFTQKGAPVEGAEVLIAQAGTCPVPGLTAPRTNKFGKFTDEIEGAAAAHVYKPGFVQASARLKKGYNILRLEPAGEVSGSVVDKEGNPVEGATVTVISVTKADGSRSSFS